MTIQTSYFPLQGGLNLEAPPLATSPGELIDCANYEALTGGGYRRIEGYVLYDGQDTATGAVPGTGDVLGVHLYKGELYAVRDDASNGRLYKATSSGWVEVDNTFTWTAGGTYRFCNYNFFGQDDQETMYIVNGIDKAVQFDGTTLTQITTGSGTDNPNCVIGHKYHLFLGVESSLVNSATGNPLDYTAASGAAEIAVGDTISDLVIAPNALLIACQDSTQTLYGSSSADFQLSKLNSTGAYAGTIKDVQGVVVGADRRGIMALSTSTTYSNFDYNSLSNKIESLAKLFDRDSVAVLSLKNNQYRIFKDSVGLYITFAGNQIIGITKALYGHNVRSACSGIDTNRDPVSFFGSSDGNVYKMDTGGSFNGDDIYAFIVTSFHHYSGPTQQKRFRLIQPDMRVSGNTSQIFIRGTTDYGAGAISRSASPELYTSGGALWDYSTWDQFTYDSLYHHDAKSRCSLTGTNMAVMISSQSNADSIHTMYGVTIHYSPRRLKR